MEAERQRFNSGGRAVALHDHLQAATERNREHAQVVRDGGRAVAVGERGQATAVRNREQTVAKRDPRQTKSMGDRQLVGVRDRHHDEPRFGDLLRAHRRRAGLTQDELGDLSAISSRTIRDIEAGKAHGRLHTINLLADGLGLQGLIRETFVEAGRRRPDDPAGTMNAVDAAPPAAINRLVGRDTDVRAMVHALESGCHRVVSVCGLGGVGKTRTVLEVARRIHNERKWPVIWVPASPTAPLAASGPLAREIQELLEAGTRAITQISRVIRRHDTLLVLDGVTDLAAPASDTVQQLLSRCPKLRVIATSRAALPIPGAHPTMVPPLPTPPGADGPPSLTALAGVPSVRLLVERVAETQPGWGLTTQDAPAVAELCRRLDGLPLALELAAHQTTVLSVQELAARPTGDLLALAPPASTNRAWPAPINGAPPVPINGTPPVPNNGARLASTHGKPATIRQLIDDSYRLLTDSDRAHLHTLTTLDPPWTIDDAAAALRRTGTDTVDTLVVLTRVGLIRRHQEQETTQFEVLNLVRGYLALLTDRWVS